MARLYADENFPRPVVNALRQLGHDVLTIEEDGKANQRYPDEAVLAAATRNGRALLTMNRKHFWRLHQAGVEHTGIVLCTYDPDFNGQAGRIHDTLGRYTDLTEQLIHVNRPTS